MTRDCFKEHPNPLANKERGVMNCKLCMSALQRTSEILIFVIEIDHLAKEMSLEMSRI
jgi:hypothetical protein